MWQILWSYIRLAHPECGVVINNSEPGTGLFWFSTHVGMTQSKEREDPDIYIYRISPELLKDLNDDHIKYCKISGSPLKHGDPYRFVAPVIENVNGRNVTIPQIMSYKHVPENVKGELITTIKRKDIVNFEQMHESIDG